MANIVVSVINDSKGVVTDDQCRVLVAALQKQVSDDFAPEWGIDATLTFVPTGAQPAPGTWWLLILKDTDKLNTVGYHELTPEGRPLGKSFAGTDQELGDCWTVTASHELLEMLADPHVNLTVFVRPTPADGKLYSYEICDPCQADSFGYDIDGVKVCNFVYPAYFLTSPPPGTKFDHMSQLQKPVPELLEFGFINAFDVNGGTDWKPISAATACGAPFRPRSPSRSERRRLPREEWRLSAVVK